MRAHEFEPHDRVDYVIYVDNKPATVYDTRARALVDLDTVREKFPRKHIALVRRTVRVRHHVVDENTAVVRSDMRPTKRGISLAEMNTLCCAQWNNYDRFDTNVRKNLRLPQHANTLELWGMYKNLKSTSLNESTQVNEVEKKLFDMLNHRAERVGAISDAKVGDSVALLHLQTLHIPGDRVHARLYGFIYPKKIVDIVRREHYDQLKFEDGTVYPQADDIFLTDIMQSNNMTKLFETADAADKIYVAYMLNGDINNRELDFRIKVNTTRSTVAEDVSSTPGGVGSSTKMVLEKDDEAQPRVRRYKNSRGDQRWEVLDWRGVRHGPEFTDRTSAREYLERHRNHLEYREEVDEGMTLSPQQLLGRNNWREIQRSAEQRGTDAKGRSEQAKLKFSNGNSEEISQHLSRALKVALHPRCTGKFQLREFHNLANQDYVHQLIRNLSTPSRQTNENQIYKQKINEFTPTFQPDPDDDEDDFSNWNKKILDVVEIYLIKQIPQNFTSTIKQVPTGSSNTYVHTWIGQDVWINVSWNREKNKDPYASVDNASPSKIKISFGSTKTVDSGKDLLVSTSSYEELRNLQRVLTILSTEIKKLIPTNTNESDILPIKNKNFSFSNTDKKIDRFFIDMTFPKSTEDSYDVKTLRKFNNQLNHMITRITKNQEFASIIRRYYYTGDLNFQDIVNPKNKINMLQKAYEYKVQGLIANYPRTMSSLFSAVLYLDNGHNISR